MSKKDTSKLSIGKERLLKSMQTQTMEPMQDIPVLKENVNKPVTYLPIHSLQPAPNDWNFFPSISPSKMLEMMFSIQENGLFNPIIVWEKEDGYMILSGHNRVEAYKRIISEYQDTEGFNREDYEKIPAIVFSENEIDENKAKEIIIDTNYIQRENDRRLMPIIVENRIDIVKNRKDKKGRTIEIVAKELGLSRTKVYEDFLIAERIIPELSEMFFDGTISKKALLKFSSFGKILQKELYEKYKDEITTDKCMKLKKTMTKEEIKELFKKKDSGKIITMQVRVPEILKDEFRTMANEWLKNKKKASK